MNRLVFVCPVSPEKSVRIVLDESKELASGDIPHRIKYYAKDLNRMIHRARKGQPNAYHFPPKFFLFYYEEQNYDNTWGKPCSFRLSRNGKELIYRDYRHGKMEKISL